MLARRVAGVAGDAPRRVGVAISQPVRKVWVKQQRPREREQLDARLADFDVSYKDNVEASTATVTVTGKGNYAGTATATFTIVKPSPDPDAPTYKNTEGGGAAWAKGTTTGLTFTFKRSADDGKTYDHFTGIKVDGADVPEGEYDKARGSVKITLKPAFLEGLAAGTHTLTALFDDGGPAEAKFTVTDAATPKGNGKDGGAGTGANNGAGTDTNANAAASPAASRYTASASGTSLARTADPLRCRRYDESDLMR